MRASHRDTPRRAPRPTRAPTPLTLDLITQEKKKTGEKVVRRARSGRALPPPPVPSPSSPLVHPIKALRAKGTTSSSTLRCRRSCRLTRRNSHPPRHRAAHLAAVARPPLCRVALRHPPSPTTQFTRASPARDLQPQNTCSRFWVGVADVLHIMTIKIHEYLGRNSVENPWWSAGEIERKSLA